MTEPRRHGPFWGLAFSAWALCTSVPVRADLGPYAAPPRVHRFENGLTLVMVPWKSPGIIAYHTLVRVGSRDEVEKGHSGFAHLFEHMMFRGTERFPEAAYEAKIQELGADNNAYTSQDFTLYTFTGPASALPDIVDMEADRFQHLAYDERQFRTETGAVLGEYNKGAASPFTKLWEALSELAFERHPYGHTTIGYLADIQAMPNEYAYSQAFFTRFYTPDNTTLFVAGDFDEAALVQLVRTHYGRWQGKRADAIVPSEPAHALGAERTLTWNGVATPQLLIGYRTPAFVASADAGARARSLRESAALEVVHGLLFDAAAPLYQALVVREQKLLTLSSFTRNFTRDPGLFVVHAELRDGVGHNEISQRVEAALADVGRGGAADRVSAVRSHLAYASMLEVETASDAAELLAQFAALDGSVHSLADYLEALAAVTPGDVARVARSYLVPSRRLSVRLVPHAGEAAP